MDNKRVAVLVLVLSLGVLGVYAATVYLPSGPPGTTTHTTNPYPACSGSATIRLTSSNAAPGGTFEVYGSCFAPNGNVAICLANGSGDTVDYCPIPLPSFLSAGGPTADSAGHYHGIATLNSGDSGAYQVFAIDQGNHGISNMVPLNVGSGLQLLELYIVQGVTQTPPMLLTAIVIIAVVSTVVIVWYYKRR